MSLPLKDIEFLKEGFPEGIFAVGVTYLLTPLRKATEMHVFKLKDNFKGMGYVVCKPREGLLGRIRRRKSGISLIDDLVPKDFEVMYYNCSVIHPEEGIAFKGKYPLPSTEKVMVDVVGDRGRMLVTYKNLSYLKKLEEEVNSAIFPLKDLKSRVNFLFRSIFIRIEGDIERNLEEILLQLDQLESVLERVENLSIKQEK